MQPGIKHDQNKPRWGLLPWGPLRDVVRALTHGAAKYSDDGWQRVEPHSRYVDAALRHITARLDGETLDQESELPHYAHAICCLLFLLWFDQQNERDDNG